MLTVKHLQPKEFIIRLNKSNPYGHIPKRQLSRTTRFFSDQLAARRCHFFLAFSPMTVKTSPALLSPRDGAARVPRQGLHTGSGWTPHVGEPQPLSRAARCRHSDGRKRSRRRPPRWWPEARAACPRRGGGAGAEEAGTDVAGRGRRGRGAAGRGRPAPSGGWMAASARGTAALGNRGRGVGGGRGSVVTGWAGAAAPRLVPAGPDRWARVVGSARPGPGSALPSAVSCGPVPVSLRFDSASSHVWPPWCPEPGVEPRRDEADKVWEVTPVESLRCGALGSAGSAARGGRGLCAAPGSPRGPADEYPERAGRSPAALSRSAFVSIPLTEKQSPPPREPARRRWERRRERGRVTARGAERRGRTAVGDVRRGARGGQSLYPNPSGERGCASACVSLRAGSGEVGKER